MNDISSSSSSTDGNPRAEEHEEEDSEFGASPPSIPPWTTAIHFTCTLLTILYVFIHICVIGFFLTDTANVPLRIAAKVMHWLFAPILGIALGIQAIFIRNCMECSPSMAYSEFAKSSVSPRVHALCGFRKDGDVFRWTRSARLILFTWVALITTLCMHSLSWGIWFGLGINA